MRRHPTFCFSEKFDLLAKISIYILKPIALYVTIIMDDYKIFRERYGGESMATTPSNGKLIYHMTSIDNLPSILKFGLLPRKYLLQNHNIQFTDVADPEILSKRERYKKALSQYVLFHFFARNPFDCAVCKKYGSKNMVIITVRRNICERNNYQIIPSHPLDSDTPDIYSYAEGFTKVRWNILDDIEHRNYQNAEIRKACMAECIVKDRVPVSDFAYIYVYSEEAKRKILKMENSAVIEDKIQVIPGMFSKEQ